MATKITRGKVKKPYAIVIYSTAGCGKSSLASGFENPIFLGPEENDELDVARFPITKTYNQIIGYLNEIIEGKHQKENFKTLVIDSIDMVERALHKDIEKSEGGKSIVLCRGGFGKAYSEAHTKLTFIKDKLEVIRDKCRMNIVILCHSVKNKFTDPLLATEYDTYEMTLHKSKKVDASDIFVDWVSAVLFLNWKTFKSEDGRFATGSDVRVLYTEYRPSHLAKNRFGFPSEIELSTTQNHAENASKITDLIDLFYSGNVEIKNDDIGILTHQIKELINQVNDELKKDQIIQYFSANLNNREALIQTKQRIEQILNEQK